MAILRKIPALILPFILTGCYEDFTPDTDFKPVLCMNSLITAGEPVEVRLSHTWLYSEGGLDKEHAVTDATTAIYVNGERAADGYTAREGDHIRIVADSRTYGHAEAEVTVPQPVNHGELEWHPVITEIQDLHEDGYEMYGYLSFTLQAELDITDNGATTDYYKLSCDRYRLWDPDISDSFLDDESVYFGGGSLDYDSEPLFSEHIGVFESVMGSEPYGFTYFTDRQFSGSTYGLLIRLSGCWYSVKSKKWDPELLRCGYTLTIHSITRSYYDWAYYVWQRDEGFLGSLGQAGLAEPMWGYSNVSTGAGVVAAQTSNKFTIDFSDFLESALRTYSK